MSSIILFWDDSEEELLHFFKIDVTRSNFHQNKSNKYKIHVKYKIFQEYKMLKMLILQIYSQLQKVAFIIK